MLEADEELVLGVWNIFGSWLETGWNLPHFEPVYMMSIFHQLH